MNPSEIIAEVAKLGVALRVEGTNLVHRGPRGALRPELIAKLKAHKPAIVAELTSAEAPRALCPADVAERSAIIAEGDGCDRSEADERALGAHRFPSWSALADAQRAEILAEFGAASAVLRTGWRTLAGNDTGVSRIFLVQAGRREGLEHDRTIRNQSARAGDVGRRLGARRHAGPVNKPWHQDREHCRRRRYL